MTDDLRKLAEAALKKSPTPSWWARWHSRDDMELPSEDAAFIAAASPDVVLGLLDRIEELEAANRACVNTVAEWGAKAGELQAEVDKYKGKWDAVSDRCNSALFDLKYARKTVEGQIRHVEQAEAERDEAREAARRLAGALVTSLEKLGLLHQFMCDAYKCDFNEDRTNMWIAFMDQDVRKFSHGPAAEALADPVVKRIVEGG